MGMEMAMALDPASVAAIARMRDPALLDPALLNMLQQTAEDLQQASTDYMYIMFMDPTGNVEDAWIIDVRGPTLAVLENTEPYATRLNFGFSGMVDSLGRYYPYWPDYHWLEAAVADVQPTVAGIFQIGLGNAWSG